MEKTKNEAAAREVRRVLKEKIRDDWSFPWPPVESNLAVGRPSASHAGHVDAPSGAPLPPARSSEATDWRERYYGSSDADSDLDPGPEGEETDKLDLRRASGTKSRYVFDSPDTVGASMEQRPLARKRKRRKLEEEEMQWNSGLACFNARRNVWTGARTAPLSVRGPSPQQAERVEFVMNKPDATDDTVSLDETTSPANQITNGHPTSHPALPSQPRAPPTEPQETNDLLPIFPPLVPTTNPIRASINPSTYPSLYSKIVLQSLTPSIPVNLSDIVRACVRAWQEGGEWPPKGTPGEVAIARRKFNNVPQMDGLIGLGLDEEKDGEKGDVGTEGMMGVKEGGLGNNWSVRRRSGHLRKGVAQVKRVFRLSGSGTGSPGGEFG